MSTEIALRALRDIKELGLKFLGVAGGEPVLELALTSQIIAAAVSCGLKPILVTNAYWATSKGTALDVLSRLRRLALSWIQISLDDHHQTFIPIERVGNAVMAAQELGFEDVKLLGVSKGNTESFKYLLFYLQEVLEADIQRVDVVDRPRVSHQYFQDSNQAQYSCEELGRSCDRPTECFTELMIDVNGDVYPCCNNFVGRIGNLADSSLRELLQALSCNEYFKIIMADGPTGLAKHLDSTKGTCFGKSTYESWCGLCARMFQTHDFRDLLCKHDTAVRIATRPVLPMVQRAAVQSAGCPTSRGFRDVGSRVSVVRPVLGAWTAGLRTLS